MMSLAPPDELVGEIRRRLLDRGGAAPSTVAVFVADDLDDLLPLAGSIERRQVTDLVLAEITGLGPLEPLLADPTVEDVMINAGSQLWVARHGRTEWVGSIEPGVVGMVIERILTPLGLRLDRTSPVVDARLADGSRLAAVLGPLAVDGTCLTIRRFRANHVPLAAMASSSVVELITEIVAQRCNIVVSGATSTGKTTLLNSLSRLIPADERIVTIEDTAELRLASSNVVRLEARPATAEGLGAVSMRDLLRAALRLRPDRLIVGEVRGDEALDMIEALSTGHDGSLSTCHANSAADALRRLDFMVVGAAHDVPLAAVQERVDHAVDVVIHLVRRHDGCRVISEIVEVRPTTDGPRTRVLARNDQVVANCERGRR